MPRVRFEPTIPASKRAKTVHALDHWATVTCFTALWDADEQDTRRRTIIPSTVTHIAVVAFWLGSVGIKNSAVKRETRLIGSSRLSVSIHAV
jgi:hypothetical protein